MPKKRKNLAAEFDDLQKFVTFTNLFKATERLMKWYDEKREARKAAGRLSGGPGPREGPPRPADVGSDNSVVFPQVSDIFVAIRCVAHDRSLSIPSASSSTDYKDQCSGLRRGITLAGVKNA